MMVKQNVTASIVLQLPFAGKCLGEQIGRVNRLDEETFCMRGKASCSTILPTTAARALFKI